MNKDMSAMQTQANNFEPLSDLVEEEECDTLVLYLPGFTKEQLRVQLTPSGVLKISGSRPLPLNQWNSFQKDFPVSKNCEASKITAKYEDGILYVRQPKRIVPKADQQPANNEKKATPSDDQNKHINDQPTNNEKKATPSNDQNKNINDTNPEETLDQMEDARTNFHEETKDLHGEERNENNDSTGKEEKKEEAIQGTNINGVSQVKPLEKVKKAKQMTVIMVLELLLAFALGICVSNLHWFYQK